jgi:hypothetical protein
MSTFAFSRADNFEKHTLVFFCFKTIVTVPNDPSGLKQLHAFICFSRWLVHSNDLGSMSAYVYLLQVAKQMHLRILYVHVEANNPPALALYKGLGYSLEQEESVEVETRLNRPRRLLLSFWVT